MMDKSDTGSDNGYLKNQSSAPKKGQNSPRNDMENKEEGENENPGPEEKGGLSQEPTPTQQKSEEKGKNLGEEPETSAQTQEPATSEEPPLPISTVILDASKIAAFAHNPQAPQILVSEPPPSPAASEEDPSLSSDSSEPEEGLDREYPSYYNEIPMGDMSSQSFRQNDNDAENMLRPFLTGNQNEPAQEASGSSSTTGEKPGLSTVIPGNDNLTFEDIPEDVKSGSLMYGDDTKMDDAPGILDQVKKKPKNKYEDRKATGSDNTTSTSDMQDGSDQANSPYLARDKGKGKGRLDFDSPRDNRSFDERKAGWAEAMSEEEQIQVAIQASLRYPTSLDSPSPTLPEDGSPEVPSAAKEEFDDDDGWLNDTEVDHIPLTGVESRSEELSPEELEIADLQKAIWLSKLDQNTAHNPGDVFGPESSSRNSSFKPIASSTSSKSTKPTTGHTTGNPLSENEDAEEEDDIYGLSPESASRRQTALRTTTNRTSWNPLVPQISTRELEEVLVQTLSLQDKVDEMEEERGLLLQQSRLLQERADLQEALRRSTLDNKGWYAGELLNVQVTSYSKDSRKSTQLYGMSTSLNTDTTRGREHLGQYKKGPSELRYHRIRSRSIPSKNSLESVCMASNQRSLPLRELESNLFSVDMSRDDTITMISNQKLSSAAAAAVKDDRGPVLMTRSDNKKSAQANHFIKPLPEDMKKTEIKRLPARPNHPSPRVQEDIRENIKFLRPLTPLQPKAPKKIALSRGDLFSSIEGDDGSETMSRQKTVIWNPIGVASHSSSETPASSDSSIETLPDGQSVREDTLASFYNDDLGFSSHSEDISSPSSTIFLYNNQPPTFQVSAIPTMQELQEVVNNPKNLPPPVQETPTRKALFQAPGDSEAIYAAAIKRKSASKPRIFKDIRQRRRDYQKGSIFQKQLISTRLFRPVPKTDKLRQETNMPRSDLCYSENINGIEEYAQEAYAWKRVRQGLDHNGRHIYKEFRTYINPQSQNMTDRDGSMFTNGWKNLCGEEFVERETKKVANDVVKMKELYNKAVHGRSSPFQSSDLNKLDDLLIKMCVRNSLQTVVKNNSTSEESHIMHRVAQILKAGHAFEELILQKRCTQRIEDIINESLPMSNTMGHVDCDSEPSPWLRKMYERRQVRRIYVKFLNGLRPNDPYDEFIEPPLGPYPYLKEEPNTMGGSTPPKRGKQYSSTQRPSVLRMAPGEGANRLRRCWERARANNYLRETAQLIGRPDSATKRQASLPLGSDTPRPGTFADPMDLYRVSDILQYYEEFLDTQPQDHENPQQRIEDEQRKLQAETQSHRNFDRGVNFDTASFYPDNDPVNSQRVCHDIHDEKTPGSFDGTSENNSNTSITDGTNDQHEWNRSTLMAQDADSREQEKQNSEHATRLKNIPKRPKLVCKHTEKEDARFAHYHLNESPKNTEQQAFSPSKKSPGLDAFRDYQYTIARLEAGRNELSFPQYVLPPKDEMDMGPSPPAEAALPDAMDVDSPNNILDLNSSPPDDVDTLTAENKTLRNLMQAVLFQTPDGGLVSLVHRIRTSENLDSDIESVMDLKRGNSPHEHVEGSLEIQGNPVRTEDTVPPQNNIAQSMSDKFLPLSPEETPPAADEVPAANNSTDVELLLPSSNRAKLRSPSEDLRRGGNITASDIRSRLAKQRRSPASLSLKKIEMSTEDRQGYQEKQECKEQVTENLNKEKCSGLNQGQENGSKTQSTSWEAISNEQEGPQEQVIPETSTISSDNGDLEMTDTLHSEMPPSRDDSSRQNISAETAHPSASETELANIPSLSRKRCTPMPRVESDEEEDSTRKRRKSSSGDDDLGDIPSPSRKRNEPMSRVESEDEVESPRKRRRVKMSRKNKNS